MDSGTHKPFNAQEMLVSPKGAGNSFAPLQV